MIIHLRSKFLFKIFNRNLSSTNWSILRSNFKIKIGFSDSKVNSSPMLDNELGGNDYAALINFSPSFFSRLLDNWSTSFLAGRIAACFDRVPLFLDEMNHTQQISTSPFRSIVKYTLEYKEKHISLGTFICNSNFLPFPWFQMFFNSGEDN